MTIAEIASALEQAAPLSLQESYDNCGLLVGDPMTECCGALLCVDVTPERVAEAVDAGCNLIVAHHPVIFRGLKRLNGATPVERTVIEAVRQGVAIYACHTCLDNAPYSVSTEMARRLGLLHVEPLLLSGGGAVGELPEALSPREFVGLVKEKFGSPTVRCSRVAPDREIRRVALCGGSGSPFIDDAIARGADAYLTSDTRYHDFVDYTDRIFLTDIGHYESEKCTTAIFQRVITEKFPNFAVRISQSEINPITYM